MTKQISQEQMSQTLELCTPVGEEPLTAEQHLAMMRAAEADERIHLEGAKVASEKKLYHAGKIQEQLPRE